MMTHHDKSPETVPFGRSDVDPATKAAMVERIFTTVAGRYDLMNDLMSGGLHRWWKREMIGELGLQAGGRLLDLAGGTGDIAFRVRNDVEDPEITICDINPAMLGEGRKRAWNRGAIGGLEWICADAESLPFEDSSFDACTIAFGLRNVTRPNGALAEIGRVLRPGGRFLCLEFSPRVTPGLAGLYDAFSDRVIPALGQAVAGDRDAYTYLVESIRRFPDPDTLAEMITTAGFGGVRYRAMTGGIAVLHGAWRL
jgi:demethylmenaquinone methyltransferase/2-methoxy-6-polyprenyl-1,4-benzoquinol methylase